MSYPLSTNEPQDHCITAYACERNSRSRDRKINNQKSPSRLACMYGNLHVIIVVILSPRLPTINLTYSSCSKIFQASTTQFRAKFPPCRTPYRGAWLIILFLLQSQTPPARLTETSVLQNITLARPQSQHPSVRSAPVGSHCAASGKRFAQPGDENVYSTLRIRTCIPPTHPLFLTHVHRCQTPTIISSRFSKSGPLLVVQSHL
jgi:hypothetical protein